MEISQIIVGSIQIFNVTHTIAVEQKKVMWKLFVLNNELEIHGNLIGKRLIVLCLAYNKYKTLAVAIVYHLCDYTSNL